MFQLKNSHSNSKRTWFPGSASLWEGVWEDKGDIDNISQHDDREELVSSEEKCHKEG